jgi:formylglycine-generating enzyme required for sulfatase activity/tetratricopeptide (TPR) repeat protein
VKETKNLVEEILDKVTTLLARQNVSAQIKPRDEFTHHNSRSLELIQEVFSQLKRVSPKTPQYYRASILVGSALSSTGDLERASRLFQQTIENSQDSAEKALAHFNLFQVQLRNKAFGDALTNLEAAIEIDKKEFQSEQYCLHDTHKYPMKRILGAGGMGCVFLCSVRLKKNKRVAVKCFWENRKGSRDEIFHEPLLMAEIAGDWVPEPLDYGYFDNAQQARAFFVTEYIDDAVDGETWLEKNGHLNVKTALPVALQIAQGLQIAHQEGIFHLDLKPANLLLKQTKKGLAVKIIDFGLSQVANSLRDKVAGQKTRTGLTTFGQAIFGTLDYAPPEQQGYTQFGQPSAKSDIFAFGKTLYRLLTGEMPLEVEPETLEDSPNWYKLLYSCTRTNPAKRPQSVGELIRLLKAVDRNRVFSKNSVSEQQENRNRVFSKNSVSEQQEDRNRVFSKNLVSEQQENRNRVFSKNLVSEQQENRNRVFSKNLVSEQQEIETVSETKKKPSFFEKLGFSMEKNSVSEQQENRNRVFSKNSVSEQQFEIVTVNRKGEITHREQKQARCQTEELGNGITLEMVYIPGGTFTMGSPENEKGREPWYKGSESPQHQVTIQPFFIAKYPVTQAQWQAVMGNNPSRFKGEKRPVETVSWDDVVKFCQRLSEKTGKDYRLPSEAEWEYACRAGTTTPFYFGETITTDLANYNGNTYASEPKGVRCGETTYVGSFPPNAFGLYDMHGNVWEWCADNWHENYEGAPSDGSIWKEGNSGQPVIRGGSWGNVPGGVRAASRDNYSQDIRGNRVGFRLAR